MKLLYIFFLSVLTNPLCTSCQNSVHNNETELEDRTLTQGTKILTGAEQTSLYFPLLESKRIGIVTNQTGMVGTVHLVDTLTAAGMNIVAIFAPEHGFRGHAEAGEKVASDIDKKTNIKVISLYGNNFKPKGKDLDGIDIMLFDIQDVGARFYTYISTLHYVMEICAETNVPLIVTDRPNPNGFYIDGPVLKPEFQSFIGMHPIPVVHGMTIGELALMINGQKWLPNGLQCELTVIPVKNYTHRSLYQLPVPPSPNLPTMASVYLYPSLCFFEGTVMSVGRGTETPFEIFGHPMYPDKTYSFKPVSKPGFALKPPFMDQVCYGMNLTEFSDSIIQNPQLELKWLMESYRLLGKKTTFFNPSMFDKLAGTSSLREQIMAGKTEADIRAGWQNDIDEFKKIRKQYLLYEDF